MSRHRFEQYLQQRADALGLEVTSIQASVLWRYYELLATWNKTTNLTSYDMNRLEEPALERLIIEPLAATPHVDTACEQWLDIGSGGGSPAIPMKVLLPGQIHLMMAESRFKKAAFLREAVRMLGLVNVDVFSGRFEGLADDSGRFDMATSRAVRLDEAATRAIWRGIKPGGTFLSFGHESGRELEGFKQIKRDGDLAIFTRLD